MGTILIVLSRDQVKLVDQLSSFPLIFSTLPLCFQDFLDDFIYDFVKITVEVKFSFSRNVSFAKTFRQKFGDRF